MRPTICSLFEPHYKQNLYTNPKRTAKPFFHSPFTLLETRRGELFNLNPISKSLSFASRSRLEGLAGQPAGTYLYLPSDPFPGKWNRAFSARKS
jgi:hypothetical protein